MALPRVPTTRTSLRLPLSYIVDWVIILCIAIVGVIFWRKSANRRPFSPVDPSISFPYVLHEKVSTATLALISVFIPAVLTAVIALTTTRATSTVAPTANTASEINRKRKHSAWRSRLWEWHAVWLGLFLSLAVTFLFVQGLKDVMGKPRPDLLSRCDLDPALTIAGGPQVVGGLEGALPLWNGLVSWTACRQKDDSILADGFQSFPSGHAAFSWCGMLYLTLYLCAKFSITIPYLLPEYYFHPPTPAAHKSNHIKPDTSNNNTTIPPTSTNLPPPTASRSLLQPRLTAAAPPAYLFPLVLLPVGIATYVASSRYSDFRHHGFDIIVGALLGMGFAWVGFRMYHLPVQRGRGWSWGARAAERVWGIRVGVGGYGKEMLDDEGAEGAEERRDVEMGLLGKREVREGDAFAPQDGDGIKDGDIGAVGIRQPLSNTPPPVADQRPAVRESRLQRPNGHNDWQSDGLRSV